MKILIASIEIGHRFREDLGNVTELAESMQKFGQLQPIVVSTRPDSSMYDLVAGGRRLYIAINLGWNEIDCVTLDSLTELQIREIELEENIQRKDMTWSERAKLVAELHRLRGNTMRATSNQVGRALASIHEDIQIAQVLEAMPELANLPSARQALRAYHTMERVILGQSLIAAQPAVSALWDLRLCAAQTLADSLADDSVDMILTAPPFGVDAPNTTTANAAYDTDSLDDTISLIPHFARILKPGACAYIFCADLHYGALRAIAANANLVPASTAIVWDKGSPASPPSTDKRVWLGQHELILVVSKGPSRTLLNQTSLGSVLRYAPPAPSTRVHPMERPQDLLRRLINVSSVPGETICDFFAGSASTLLAATLAGRRSIGAEINPAHYGLAIARLQKLTASIKEEPTE